MVVQRGEIWWADLRDPTGSEPGYRPPVLVVQADDFIRSRIASVIVVVVSSNLRLAQAPGNVLLSRRASGLPKDSVANASQVITLDKSFLTERVGALPRSVLQQVEDGLRLTLGLG